MVDERYNYVDSTGERNLKTLEKRVSYHLVQFFYAKNYLLERTEIPLDRILFVSDYIGDCYRQAVFPALYCQNMALYNSRKGYENIVPLIENTLVKVDSIRRSK